MYIYNHYHYYLANSGVVVVSASETDLLKKSLLIQFCVDGSVGSSSAVFSAVGFS